MRVRVLGEIFKEQGVRGWHCRQLSPWSREEGFSSYRVEYATLHTSDVIIKDDVGFNMWLREHCDTLFRQQCPCINDNNGAYVDEDDIDDRRHCKCNWKHVDNVYMTVMPCRTVIRVFHPLENGRIQAFLETPDPLYRVASILKEHLEVAVDLTQVSSNAREHAMENDTKRLKTV